MYRGPILESRQREYPGRRTFKLLEDNDPSGFKTKKAAVAVVEEAGWTVVDEFKVS